MKARNLFQICVSIFKSAEKQDINGSKDMKMKEIKASMIEVGLPIRSQEKLLNILKMRCLRSRKKHMLWGPKKLLPVLQKSSSEVNWPSTTTIGKILDKHGLVIPRKKRIRYPAKTDPLSHSLGPNDVWCTDFKGGRRVNRKMMFDPFTLTDAYSRYILECIMLSGNTCEYVWQQLEKVFYEYGLPLYLRHDNGPPFATSGPGRLSRLSVLLIKAGVIPEWIDPGKPQQNGRHEIMHLTIEVEEVIPSPLLTKTEGNVRYADFKKCFNYERPHEALNQDVPGNVYIPSNRAWDGKLKAPEYCQDCLVRRVRNRGQMAWNGTDLYIGKALSEEYIALKQDADGYWEVYFGPVFFGADKP